MDIIIIANFCSDFSEADSGRFSYLAEMLSDENEVEIITSDFFHISKQYRKPIPEKKYKITLIHETGYKKNVCLQRFFSHYVWGNNVIDYIKHRKKPDVIYNAIPSLTEPSKVSKYCKKNNIRFIIDIQDLWPEAFKMVFDIPVISDLVFYPFSVIACGVYSRADAICAVSESYLEFAKRHNRSAVGAVAYLGTDLSKFDKNKLKKNTFRKERDLIWIGYCGTLGQSYDLEIVIDALIKVNNPSVRLIVMGDGPLRESFESYANMRGAKCSFLGRLPYPDMCSVLNMCDITVNPIVGNSVASIINKHADYAASGLPVINTQNSDEYCRLVEEYNMGVNILSGNVDDIADSITLLIDNEELRSTMGKNARKCAEERFDRRNSYQALKSLIMTL